MDTLLRESHAAAQLIDRLNRDNVLALNGPCSPGGNIDLSVTDNGDGRVSAGDTIRIEYTSCRAVYFDAPFSGSVQIELNGFETNPLGEIQFQGSYTRDAETWEFAYFAGANGDSIVARSSPLDAVVRLDDFRVSDFEFRRDVLEYETGRVFSVTADDVMLSVRANVADVFVDGTYTCGVVSALGTVQQGGRRGEIDCFGAQGTRARAEILGEQVLISVSDDDGQSYSEVGRLERSSYFSTYWFQSFFRESFPEQLNPVDALQTIPTSVAEIATVAMIKRPNTDLVLALSASAVGGLPDRIVEINPVSGEIVRSRVFDAEPISFAAARDGSIAYVAFRSEPIVQKVDLASFEIIETIDLPQEDSQLESRAGRKISVSPVNPDDFIIALWRPAVPGIPNDGYRETVLYSGGQFQPRQLGGVREEFPLVEFLGADGTRAIASEGTLGRAFAAIEVAVDGLIVQSTIESVADLRGAFHVTEDSAIGLDGAEVRGDTGKPIGRFEPFFESGRKNDAPFVDQSRTLVTSDAGNDRTYFFNTILETYESSTYSYLSGTRIDLVGTPHSIVDYDSQSLILASDREFHLIRKTDIPDSGDRLCMRQQVADFASGDAFDVLPCAINDAVYVPSTDEIVVALAGANGRDGNSIATYDATALTRTGRIGVGSEPKRFDVSDSGARLYASVRGSAEYVWVDLLSQSVLASQRVPLSQAGFERLEQLRGGPIAFLPASDLEAVAVALRPPRTSPVFDRLSLLTSGQLADVDTADFPQSVDDANAIEFGSDSGLIYGLDNSSTGLRFTQFEVTTSGITGATNVTAGVGEPLGEFEFSNGQFFFSNGEVLTENGFLVDTPFPISADTESRNPQLLAVDPAGEFVFFYFRAGNRGSALRVEKYDINTRQKVSRAIVPRFGNGLGEPLKLLSLGQDRVAIVYSSRLVVLEAGEFVQF
ncbi:MAG: hypothetical protein AAF578_03795 [Pseudomonadota bacterium]